MVNFQGGESEQFGLRPALVFSNNCGNYHSPNVIVYPLTSAVKKQNQPTHVLIRAVDSGLLKDSMVLCENPVCVSKTRLLHQVSKLPTVYLRLVAEAAVIATSAAAFLDEHAFIRAKRLSVSLNRTVT